ncbi:HET domain containing protein [Hyaloscypha variabilis]
MSWITGLGGCRQPVTRRDSDRKPVRNSIFLSRDHKDSDKIVQLELWETRKLQTLSSRISDSLSRKKKSRHHDILCAACSTFSEDEALYSKMKSRAQDQCPLCQVILHIVTQALAGYQAGNLWTRDDLPISLDLHIHGLSNLTVFYDKIAIGRIALWSRSLNFRGSAGERLGKLPDCKLDTGSLRYILGQFFGDKGILHTFTRNIRPYVAIQISRKLGFQTEEYQYYSKISPAAPSQTSNHSFILPVLKECEETHRRNREASPEDSMTAIDIMLVDVAQGKLVNAQITSYRYLALSYVWGKGALFALHGQLPRVLQDAMDVTRYLGERYLWCDALCIVQDDADFKHSQIALMGDIYGQALLTICALSSPDASVGLLGFSEPAPGGLPLDIVRSTKNFVYVSSPPELEHIAQLCLFFTSTHVYFQDFDGGLSSCDALGRPISAELGHGDWDLFPKATWHEGDISRKEFDWDAYLSLMERYSMRQLTESHDVIYAFTAISLKFGNFYSSPTVKGIPTAVFSHFLGWVGTKVLKRRTSVLSEPLQPSRIFPSWSWFGWKGPVTLTGTNFWFGEAYYSYVEKFLLEELDRVTELKESRPVRHHERTIRTPIRFTPTAHPAMLHFMGYCVDSSWFRNKEGVLYSNLGRRVKGSEHLHEIHDFTEPEAYREPEPLNNLNSNKESSDELCGGIQIIDPELLPLCDVLQECKFVLLPTMTHFAYKKELWSPEISWVFQHGYATSYAQENVRPWPLNALLIKKKNIFWERIGIAVITQEAWDSSDPKEEYVQLV